VNSAKRQMGSSRIDNRNISLPVEMPGCFSVRATGKSGRGRKTGLVAAWMSFEMVAFRHASIPQRSDSIAECQSLAGRASTALRALRHACARFGAGASECRGDVRREYRTHTEIKLAYDGEPGEGSAYLLLPRTTAPRGCRRSLRRTSALAVRHRQGTGRRQMRRLARQAYAWNSCGRGSSSWRRRETRSGSGSTPSCVSLGNGRHSHEKGQWCCCIASGGSWFESAGNRSST